MSVSRENMSKTEEKHFVAGLIVGVFLIITFVFTVSILSFVAKTFVSQEDTLSYPLGILAYLGVLMVYRKKWSEGILDLGYLFANKEKRKN